MQSCEIVVRLGSTEIAHISNSSDISNLEVFLDSFVFLDAPTDKFDLNVILANELLAKFLCRFKVVPEPKHQVETFNIIFFVHSYLIISYTNDPPGDFCTVRLGSSVGYQGIPLDPQGPKMGFASRISGPDQRGRLRQVPGGPEPGHHQGLISGQSSWNRNWGWLSGLISGVSGPPGPSVHSGTIFLMKWKCLTCVVTLKVLFQSWLCMAVTKPFRGCSLWVPKTVSISIVWDGLRWDE